MLERSEEESEVGVRSNRRVCLWGCSWRWGECFWLSKGLEIRFEEWFGVVIV